MITVQQERLDDLWDEITPLWVQHHAEIARDADRVPLAPDCAKYAAMERDGKLLIVTARQAGALVGYAFSVIDTHLHYRTSLMGFFDIYWLKPSLRGSLAGTGIKLIRYSEAIGSARGVVKWFIGSKVWQDHSAIFARMGWSETERLFTKVSA